MGEKYEVPLKNESGEVIGTARIDPDEFPGGVVEVEVTEENLRRSLQPELYNLSIYVPPESRLGTALTRPIEAIQIKQENKEKNDG